MIKVNWLTELRLAVQEVLHEVDTLGLMGRLAFENVANLLGVDLDEVMGIEDEDQSAADDDEDE